MARHREYLVSDGDIILLQKWRDGRDAQAFAQLVSKHADMVYATCRRILRNDSHAEDVAQQCFIVLSTHDHRVKKSVGAWLHTVATRRALNFLRAEARRRKREEAFAASALEAAEPTWDDIQEYVDLAIEEQSEKVRRVLVAYFFEQQTQQAIGEAMGIPRRTVSHLIDKGVKGIRKSLRRKGVTVAAAALTGLITANGAAAAPTTLVVSLGKLAMAGTAGATSATTVAAGAVVNVMGGVFLMKKAVVGIAVLILGVLAVWSITETIEPAVSGENVSARPEGGGPGTEKVQAPESASSMEADLRPPSGALANVAESRGTDSNTLVAAAPVDTEPADTSTCRQLPVLLPSRAECTMSRRKRAFRA